MKNWVLKQGVILITSSMWTVLRTSCKVHVLARVASYRDAIERKTTINTFFKSIFNY